ncbi:MAG: hypothetical protein ABIH03_13675, partial [Pseudomonadota bacterium]
MATGNIIDVKEDWSPRLGEKGPTGVTAVRRFTVLTEAAPADVVEGVICADAEAEGLPTYGSSYGPASPLVCHRRRVSKARSPTLYEVEAQYVVPAMVIGEGTGFPTYGSTPMDQPPEISWDTVRTNEPIDRVRRRVLINPNGQQEISTLKESATGTRRVAVTTLNGEAPDPPLTADHDDGMLAIKINLASFDDAAYDLFRETV